MEYCDGLEWMNPKGAGGKPLEPSDFVCGVGGCGAAAECTSAGAPAERDAAIGTYDDFVRVRVRDHASDARALASAKGGGGGGGGGGDDPMAPAVLHLEAEHESVRIGIYDDFIQPPPPPPRGAEEGEGGRARSAAEATVELEAERRPNDRRSQADMRALDLLSGEAEDDPPSPARLEADVRAGLSSEC